MTEEEYTKVTYQYAIEAAKAFGGLKKNSEEGEKKFVFAYLSGARTTQDQKDDGNGWLSTPMWAKVKGMLSFFSLFLFVPFLIRLETFHRTHRTRTLSTPFNLLLLFPTSLYRPPNSPTTRTSIALQYTFLPNRRQDYWFFLVKWCCRCGCFSERNDQNLLGRRR